MFCDKHKFNLNDDTIQIIKKKVILLIYWSLLIYTLWYQFSNYLDAQSDFDKTFVTKKLVKLNHSYLNYALVIMSNEKEKIFSDLAAHSEKIFRWLDKHHYW